MIKKHTNLKEGEGRPKGYTLAELPVNVILRDVGVNTKRNCET